MEQTHSGGEESDVDLCFLCELRSDNPDGSVNACLFTTAISSSGSASLHQTNLTFSVLLH